MNYLSKLITFSNFTYAPEFSMTQYCEANQFSVNYEKIRKYFGIDDGTLINKSELEAILYLKDIAYEVLSFGNQTISDRKYDSLDYFSIIDIAKRNKDQLNCRYKSFIFAQLLMACGFRSRWVGCLPMDPSDKECHCITEVYSHYLGKWFVVDIAFNFLYFNAAGTLLNLYEIRNNLITGNKVRFISKDKATISDTYIYLTKNMFKFRFAKQYKYLTTLSSDEYILLHPDKYIIDNSEYKEYSQFTTNAAAFW